ncbi:hypothetical protein [Streptomyces macrosporus]|uniref:Lipoprotein n=1 Tax=Streptomyces macrosporus TaxID=44032 RepID=A0ABP5WU47_9ACTN
MRHTLRRVLSFAVLSSVVLSGAACGGTADSAAESPAKPLTAEELAAALPEGDDFPGFTAKPQDTPLLEDRDVVTADVSACQPIADMMSARPEHARRALVWATLKVHGAPADAPPGSVSLAGHTVGDARATMDDLREALSGCDGFTASSRRGWTYRFTVERLSPVQAGDESVAYLLTNTLAPEGKGNVMTVVRTGGVLATYLVVQDPDRPRPVPASIAATQHERLRDAGAGG